MNSEITFATYNVEGIQNSVKRIKFLKFLKVTPLEIGLFFSRKRTLV